MRLERKIGISRALLRQVLTGGESRFLPRYSERDEDLFFRNGWGDEALLNEMTSRSWLPTAELDTIACIEYRESELSKRSFNGTFESPLAKWLPKEARQTRFRVDLPDNGVEFPPVAIICPMTGDEGFSHRTRAYSQRLLKQGIAVVLMQSPFYGQRRVQAEPNIFISNVANMALMCNTLVEEARLVIQKMYSLGYPKIVVAGVSQGGMVACAAAALSDVPVGVAASLVAHSPHVIFSRGLLKAFTDWSAIQGDDEIEHTVRRLKSVFEAGDITRLPLPKRLDASILQAARFDAVTPRSSVEKVHTHWAGSELRILPGTHLTSIFLHSRSFARLVADAIARC